MLYNSYLNALNTWIKSLDLNSTERWIISCLFIEGYDEEKSITDNNFNKICGTKFKNVRRELRNLKNKFIINIKNDDSNRTIQLVIPHSIKQLKKLPLSNIQKALTLTGTPIEEITSCYEGKQITEVKLRNVRSSDGSIFFGTYWIDKNLITLETETETETECLTFKAVPYITESEQLLLNITKQMSQHA